MKTSALKKIETQVTIAKLTAFVVVFALAFLISCNSDEDGLGAEKEDSETAQLDALEDSYQEDAEDLALEVLENPELSGGRISADNRLTCAEVTQTGTKNEGTITIDFGIGCTDARGNLRKGLIVIEFEGRWTVPGSSWTLRFVNHFLNEVAIEGTRVVTNISASETGTQVFTVVMEGGSMTWPDGTIARRTVHKTRELERDENNLLNRLIIYGSAEGNHRNGRGYQVGILEPLIYDRACTTEGVIIPVSGKKLIKHGQREITVDYGDGTCDNIVSITNKNGRTWIYTVGDH